MSKTTIEWTERVWNPVTGCSRVSPGCDHCYAETLSRRFKRSVGPWTGANAKANVRLHPERLEEPLKVRKPSMFFVCSMGDLFHELVPWDFISQVFGVMDATPQHTYQVLTKRPGRMAYFARNLWPVPSPMVGGPWASWPPNVWAGTSVESAKWLPRLDVLARVPAKVHFVSAEPLLGPLDLKRHLYTCACGQSPCVCKGLALNWVIAGGESGPGHRVADPAWFASLRDQCQAAGMPFFMKQDSGSRPGTQGRIPDDVWACKEMPV